MPSPPIQPSPSSRDASGATGPLGVVLGGGGARAAYQVGVLRSLARRFPELDVPVVTGVSAGAINAAVLASHHGNFSQSVRELSELWGNLTVSDVFRTDSRSLLLNVFRWATRLVSGGLGERTRVRGLVDTDPLRKLLKEVLHAVDGELTGIDYNVARGSLRAVGLSTSSYTTGRSVTWIQGAPEVKEWERPQRIGRKTRLTVEHVMASSALPLFFPAIRLEDGWYGDGGIRLAAPLSPALHLGAKRILVLSTRYDRSVKEAREPAVEGYPPPAQVASQLLNSVFLDVLDEDAWRTTLINRLLEKIPPGEREGLKIVDILTIRPSEDLGRLAAGYEPELPVVFRWLTRGLGTRQTESPDSLSMILFEPDYLRHLMDVGEADAEKQSDRIEAFLRGESHGDRETRTRQAG